jgi:hypothetical protein
MMHVEGDFLVDDTCVIKLKQVWILRFLPRRSTRAPYKVWQYDQPSKTIPRLLGKLARGLNGISGIRRR